jgi:hypothetical protein
MSEPGDSEGHKAFFALAMLIFGALLFGAGLMVGRQMATPECGEQDPLSGIDQRDRLPATKVGDDKLQFPNLLDDPDRDAGHARTTPPVVHGQQRGSVEEGRELDAGVAGDASGGDSGDMSQPGSIRFSVQVAAFKDSSQAETLAARLREKGHRDVRVLEGPPSDKGSYFRVRVGRTPERSLAEELAKRLGQEEHLQGLVVSEEGDR